VLFGGHAETAIQQATIVLSCSLKHMIGNAVAGQVINNPQADSGNLQAEIHHESSSNIMFSATLRELVKAERGFAEAQYDPATDLARRRARHQLTDEATREIARRRWINRLVSVVYPAGWGISVLAVLLKPLVYPLLWLVLGGRARIRAKAAALHSAAYHAKRDVDDEVAREQLQLVKSIRPAAHASHAPAVTFDAIALRLVDEERVVLASPLFLTRRL
jgi:hypothetical protein